MPFEFNSELWNWGRKIEDEVMPIANKLFNANFERNDNDIFDIFDFHDNTNKIVCEVKGRRIRSDEYEDTIVTASKVMSGYQKIDDGYKVYFIFVFTDKMMRYELKEDVSLKCKFTGTNCIKHYLIPVAELVEIEDLDPVPEAGVQGEAPAQTEDY